MSKKGKVKKEVSVGFALGRDAASKLKTEGAQALDASQIVVRSGTKLVAPGAAGYESRLWEKVTCRISDPLIDPEEILTHPERLGINMATTKTRATKLGSRKASS